MEEFPNLKQRVFKTVNPLDKLNDKLVVLNSYDLTTSPFVNTNLMQNVRQKVRNTFRPKARLSPPMFVIHKSTKHFSLCIIWKETAL